MDPLLGTISIFSGDFAPSGYAYCQGALLSISGNTALFSLVGTYYGGNGTSNFGLPDLRGRTPIGFGTGTGLSNYNMGQTGGLENVTLLTSQMPAHNHALLVDGLYATTAQPDNTSYISASPFTGSGPNATAIKTLRNDTVTANLIQLNPNSISTVGGSQPHSNLQPYLAINYIIALQGIYPARS